MGDLNVTRYDELEQKTEEYEKMMKELGEGVIDLWEEDHNGVEGIRTSSQKPFEDPGEEAMGTFYEGAQRERGGLAPDKKHNYTWGTVGFNKQAIKRCVEDHIMKVKPAGYEDYWKKVTVRTQIRQIEDPNKKIKCSGLSDHLPLSAIISFGVEQ